MVFSSTLFLSLFLPTVLGVYFLAKEKFRNFVLLTASLFFYAWGEPKAVWIMIILIVLSYFVAQRISCSKSKKLWLALGVIINLSALFYYKYWMFFIENINVFLTFSNLQALTVPKITLPIGISFYIFQIISYLVDVYRNEVSYQKNIFALATYVSLFPQLVAGPIVRYQTIAEDINNRETKFDNIYWGLKRFTVGLAKKVLIADNMAFVADTIFDAPVQSIPCVFAWLGVVAYSLQIFYDFSGYSDMAIGLGRVFNFRFLENFEYPYSAKSIQDFWRRWHISLSTWFRDYLYIPLGGNRQGKFRTLLNSYVVFGLCGLWHGATWNFVVWGLFHGTGLIMEKLGLKKVLEKIGPFFANIYVWIFVLVGWVFFRAKDLPTALSYLKIMFCGNDYSPLNSFYPATQFISYGNFFVLILGVLFAYPYFAQKYQKIKGGFVDNSVMLLLFVVAYAFAMTSTFSPFIYFRF